MIRVPGSCLRFSTAPAGSANAPDHPDNEACAEQDNQAGRKEQRQKNHRVSLEIGNPHHINAECQEHHGGRSQEDQSSGRHIHRHDLSDAAMTPRIGIEFPGHRRVVRDRRSAPRAIETTGVLFESNGVILSPSVVTGRRTPYGRVLVRRRTSSPSIPADMRDTVSRQNRAGPMWRRSGGPKCNTAAGNDQRHSTRCVPRNPAPPAI